MTRWLLVLGLWGMLAGTAWAETTWIYPLGDGQTIDISKSCHDIGATALTLDDKLIQCRGSKGWTQIQMICERKMQAAMEAMEPFVPRWWVDLDLPMNGGVRQELMQADVSKFRGAVTLWADAKACWRKP